MDYITFINMICRAVNREIDVIIEGLKIDNISLNKDGVSIIFENTDVSTNLRTNGALILHKCKMCGLVFASEDRYKIKCPKCGAEFTIDKGGIKECNIL